MEREHWVCQFRPQFTDVSPWRGRGGTGYVGSGLSLLVCPHGKGRGGTGYVKSHYLYLLTLATIHCMHVSVQLWEAYHVSLVMHILWCSSIVFLGLQKA